MFPGRRMSTIALLGAAALALTACGAAAAPAGDAEDTATIPYTWERNVNAADDQADPELESTTVDIPLEPQKIVAFEVATIDTIGALGGEVAGAPLDSVPDYLQEFLADEPFSAGTLFEADLLEIEAQQPDLIIVGGRSAALYDDLSEIAPTIDLGIQGSYLETLERNVTLLGEVLGAEELAATTVAELNAEIEDVRSELSERGTGLSVMIAGGQLTALAPTAQGTTPPSSAAVRGGLTYDVFGLQPAVDDVQSVTHGEPISFEFLLEHDPDLLFVVDRDSATGESTEAAEQVLDNDIVAQTSAARSGDIHYLSPVPWYIVYGGVATTRLMIEDVRQALR